MEFKAKIVEYRIREVKTERRKIFIDEYLLVDELNGKVYVGAFFESGKHDTFTLKDFDPKQDSGSFYTIYSELEEDI